MLTWPSGKSPRLKEPFRAVTRVRPGGCTTTSAPSRNAPVAALLTRPEIAPLGRVPGVCAWLRAKVAQRNHVTPQRRGVRYLMTRRMRRRVGVAAARNRGSSVRVAAVQWRRGRRVRNFLHVMTTEWEAWGSRFVASDIASLHSSVAVIQSRGAPAIRRPTERRLSSRRNTFDRSVMGAWKVALPSRFTRSGLV